MREIKFRIWNKEYEYGFMDYSPLNEFISFDGKVTENKFIESYGLGRGKYEMTDIDDNRVLMQYTGLKDVNYSEVFERDILSFITEVEHDTETDQFYGAEKREERCYIVWNDDFSRFDAKTIGRSRMGKGFPLWVLFDGGGYEPKIIGNIYENPELLEVE